MRQVLQSPRLLVGTFLIAGRGKENTNKTPKGLAELRRHNRYQEGKVAGKSKAEVQKERSYEEKELQKSSNKAP